MSLKDVILLIVPIVMNGFLIFVFQSFVSKKMEVKRREQNFKYEVTKQYYVLLQMINEVVNTTIKESPNLNDDELSKMFNTVSDRIWKAREFLESNSMDLELISDTYYSIEKEWNSLINGCKNLQILQQADFAEHVSKYFNQFHLTVLQSIKTTRKHLEKFSQ